MAEVHKINAKLPNVRSLVKFRNSDTCMVITAGKAASDAKALREAAGMIHGAEGSRPRAISEWLAQRAAEFEKCEAGNDGTPDKLQA